MGKHFILFAFYLLICAPVVKTQEIEINQLQELRSDKTSFNAERASMTIRRKLDPLMNPQGNYQPLLQAVKEGLDAKDYQQRQYCTWILYEYYARKENKIPESQWPSRIFDNLIEGLHDDTVSSRNCFSNSSMFLSALYDLKERRPVKQLQKLLNGDDAQARFAAAIVLSNYCKNSVQLQISKELFSHLKDDSLFMNEFAACQAYMLLGEKNFKAFFQQQKAVDWQQAAYLQFLTSLYGISWKPDSSFINKWVGRLCDSNYQEDAKICVAALYLTPNYQKYFKEKKMPYRLNKLSELSQNLHSQKAKAKWVSSNFWFLQLENSDEWYKPPNAACWTLIDFH